MAQPGMLHMRPAIFAGIAAALAAVLAIVTREPFVFPSLGASAYLCATMPKSPAAQPRTVLVSHVAAALIGFGTLHLTGLDSHVPAAVEGMTAMRATAVAISLALTVAATSAFAVLHPPAGATALIVTLGILSSVHEVLILVASIFIFAAGIWSVQQLAKAPKPRRRARAEG